MNGIPIRLTSDERRALIIWRALDAWFAGLASDVQDRFDNLPYRCQRRIVNTVVALLMHPDTVSAKN